MQKFEYQTVYIYWSGDGYGSVIENLHTKEIETKEFSVINIINYLGEQGWEITHYPRDYPHSLVGVYGMRRMTNI